TRTSPATLFPYTPLFRSPQFREAARVAVDEGRDAELLGEAPQLADRRGVFAQIDEMDFHAPLGEEAQRRARLRRAARESPFRRRSEEHTSELQSRGQLVC